VVLTFPKEERARLVGVIVDEVILLIVRVLTVMVIAIPSILITLIALIDISLDTGCAESTSLKPPTIVVVNP
jgi:hypothetical protein